MKMQLSKVAFVAAIFGATAIAVPVENLEEHIARDVVDGPKAVVADMQPRAVAPTAPPVTPAPSGPTPPAMPTQCNDPVGDWMVAECLSYADGLIPPTPLTKRGAFPQETGMAMNKDKLIAKGFIAGDAMMEPRDVAMVDPAAPPIKYYPACGAPICFNAVGKAFLNMEKREVIEAVAQYELEKRQTYYPDCGAPICFDAAGKSYANKAVTKSEFEKREVIEAVAQYELEKRQTYYPDCGAPICFDAAGKSYANKAVTKSEFEKRQTYYPDCGAPICFDAAGKAYENEA